MRNWKLALSVTAIAFVLVAPLSADSLAVNNAAALGGTGTNCGGGNCGLEVSHDNTSLAYVQDNSPADEGTYRASFLLDPNSMGVGNTYRLVIMTGHGNNPNQGVGNCSVQSFRQAFQVVLIRNNAGFHVQMLGLGNQCGYASTLPRKVLISDGPNRICAEWQSGVPGRFSIAVANAADPCPTSGGPEWATRTQGNHLWDGVAFVRLGSVSTNAPVNGSFYLDEFESFRTLAP